MLSGRQTHVLATLALSQLLDFVWQGKCPAPISQIIFAEKAFH
jgi:hypothetical protein